ncbi:MAG: alanine--tRNA ligase [Bacteroidetes bacterium]|nr:alanine--tRNA ligase [Bacteroidota bacterium]
MTSNEIRQKFLNFFEKKGYKKAPSSSLVPEGDASVLFTTAGMQQFKPFYIGTPSPFGDKVVSAQKCIRTSDIDDVGDDTHLTFFEMLGNFSFNNAVSKKEAINYGYEFITKEMGLKIDYVSVFKDDESGIKEDSESRQIWKEIDPSLEIRDHKKEDNFWGPTGDEGPCGPTTEIYINGVEIWNIVFNEYYKDKEGNFKKLDTFGIDTGMGLERLLVQSENKNNIYETDLFFGEKTKEERIVIDHVKAALFLTTDGVVPGNTGQGYILRRLIRRAVRFSGEPLSNKIEAIKKIYEGVYDLDDRGEIAKEEERFKKTLEKGMKEFEAGVDPFVLFTTYGFPIELTEELAREKGWEIDRSDFDKKIQEHQKLSQSASAGMFKGGLANHNEKTVKLHTAHHLLLAALQEVLGPQVKQRGSNITEERLRIDFSFDRKMTDEEKLHVENIVNDMIGRDLKVVHREMSKDDAQKIGAEMEFGAKYGDKVSVYFIEDDNGKVFSKEFCGGPHVEHIGLLGKFKILKEEASSLGVRRIKATFE